MRASLIPGYPLICSRTIDDKYLPVVACIHEIGKDLNEFERSDGNWTSRSKKYEALGAKATQKRTRYR